MALTESQMLPLGTQAPDFELTNVVTSSLQKRDELKGSEGTLIVFMCNHCPYVVHLLDALIAKAANWKTKGVHTIGISSNSVLTHPQDGPEAMQTLAMEKKFDFPYLYDPDQKVANAYDAACTPDFYLFDSKLHLYYRGRFDGSRPGNEEPLTGLDLDQAITAMLQHKTPLARQLPSMGCNIKWTPGNEPKWWHG